MTNCQLLLAAGVDTVAVGVHEWALWSPAVVEKRLSITNYEI